MEINEYFKLNRESKERKSDTNKEMSRGDMYWSSRDNTDNTPDHNERKNRDGKNRRNDRNNDMNRSPKDKRFNDNNQNHRDHRDHQRNNNQHSNRENKPKEKYRPVNMFNPNKPLTTDPIPVTVVQEPETVNKIVNKIDDIPTNTGVTGWRPKRIDTSTPAGKIEYNVRTAQGYLNKMTQTTFDSLSDKFVEIAISEKGNVEKNELPLPGQLKILIDRIFEQALLQPTFCPMYSSLCEKIHRDMKNFRMVLLTKCQEEFEMGSKLPDNVPSEELDGYLFKAKKRMLGNIKFIGELYKSNIIVEPVMYECFNHLLRSQNTENLDEEQIEALCKLLLNIGKILDPSCTNTRINNCFEQMEILKTCDTLSPRVRFLIEDVIDIRNNNWTPLR